MADKIPGPPMVLKEALHNEIYKKHGLNTNDGKNCISYLKCSRSCELEKRRITPPTGAYIGEKYEETRLLFIGINTNVGSQNSDSFYSVYDWISGNDSFIAGSIHRITLKYLNSPKMQPAESLKYFAFTNSIKCSVMDYQDNAGQAGKPTTAMGANCVYLNKFLFREIEILTPKMIIALGAIPFEAIKTEYIDKLSFIDENFSDRLFSIYMNDYKVIVCGLLNPGNYTAIRGINKRIKATNKIPFGWGKYMIPDIDLDQNISTQLENKFSSGQRVDKANPFYDQMIDKLFLIANKY